MNMTVIATVDAGRSGIVIWWTNVRAERTSSFARNCGAWDLKKNDLAAIDALTVGKVCLATPTGRKFLEANATSERTYLDADGTLAAVLAEQQRLELVLGATKSGATAKPMPLPTEPGRLDPTKARELSAPTSVQRTLAISRWLVLVSEYWESIEAVRMSRPALRKLDDGGLRELPLVLELSRPASAKPARTRSTRTRKADDALMLPFDDPAAG